MRAFGLSAVLTLLIGVGVLVAPAGAAELEAPAASPLESLATVEETAHVLVFTKTAAFRHTEAITQGTPKLRAALTEAGISSEHTEDSAIFNDVDLARFDALVMFQTSGDPWTASEKAALERYQRAGHGIVAIHNATDMRGNYAWWDNLVGSLMPGHAATGTSPGLQAQVIVEDQVHPSTRHLGDRWTRSDEWYNFSTNVRGKAHVLATMDETTYNPGSNAMGYDHPISWCKPYDGGRAWVTAMGHYGAHYDEPALLGHIVGGVKYAAGVEAGECGGTIDANFEKVTLDDNTSAPFALDVAPDGRVVFTELVRGQIRVYDPRTGNVKTALTLDVYSGGEDGLLGITVAPDFATTGHLYVYYSPDAPDNSHPSSFFNRVSRFTMDATSTIDPASERVIIDVPARRAPDEPGHTGGGLDFDLEGNLLLSVGDDVNPHSEPSGGYAPLSERTGTFHDARETSANTNDLRGKLLRITPGPDGGYTIPAGNLFPESADTGDRTRPEIYAMGFRNPFRFSVDPNTGWIGLADYAPDAGTDNFATRGPAGIVEWNLIKSPGNYGWPLCIGNQVPYRDVDYTTTPETIGPNFDCANPVNDSRRNTGLTNLPPSRAPEMYYGYRVSSVPSVIPAGGGLAPMGGPFYDYDPALESDVKFPQFFDGKAFFYEWVKNRVYPMVLSDTGKLEKIYRFGSNLSFLAPQDMEFGPDGAMYTLEWGGGFGRDNPNSGIYRVDYISGSRSPVARATASTDNGPAPLEVAFSSAGSSDPEGEPLTYAWDFDGDGTTDSTAANPTHTYTATGVFQARLTVTDPASKSGTAVVPITVGNTRPLVRFNGPINGGLIDWGDRIDWDVEVTDPEDGAIDYQDLIVSPALGHDEHAHPTTEYRGKTGSLISDLGAGHSEDMKVFFALDARYTDKAAPGAPALTGSSTIVLQPKHKEAEHADGLAGTEAAAVAGDPDGGGGAGLVGLGAGDWAAYRPINLTGIEAVTLRVASSASGGGVELRRNSPTGALLGSAAIPRTGGTTRWADVTVPVSPSTETLDLYLVATGSANFRLNFLEFVGKGISPETRPRVAITAPQSDEALQPGTNVLAAAATDAENAIEKVEFFVDGAKVGEDAAAPYETTWTETREDYYVVHAVATNSKGLVSDSRRVRFTVGEIGIRPPWATFSSAEPEATFSQDGPNAFTVSAAGADVWQGTNQYGTIYLPGGAPENFVATVRVASFNATHNSAKAGIMVRNDITDAGKSPGYLVVAEKGSGDAEFMHDAGGNGQLNNTGEPVATACPGNNVPTWLRVQKFGKAFSVYCSKDSLRWTQVGATTQIASAASVQDIGLFVVSHISGTRATANFTDWSIDTDPQVPGEPDPAPTCPPARSDEFDGPLDRSRWTAVRGSASTTGGSLVLPVTAGDIAGAGTGPISHVAQATPAGDWQATTRVSLAHDGEGQHAALAIRVDDDNFTKLAFVRGALGARAVEFWSETAGIRTDHGTAAAVPAATPSTIQLRLTSASGTLTAAWSADGTTWTPVGLPAVLKTGGTLGLLAAGDRDVQNLSAAFEFFRLSPDPGSANPGFDDEFDGTALDGCRWDRIHNYNGNRLSVADGALSIETAAADINGANNGPVENLVLQTAPAGDWTAEAKMTAPLADNWQLAGLLLFSDADHYVKYDVVADNAAGAAPDRRVELRYENGGPLTAPSNEQDLRPPPASPTDTWWLRLTRRGDTYTGAISADGQTWVRSPGSVTVALSAPAVGVMAIGPDQAAPVTVDFDHFRIVPTPNAAPALSQARADVTTGFAPLAVRFTAAAEDADGDELRYSWDFDGNGTTDSTAQNPTHTYTAAGTYDARVTVSDGRGATDSRVVPVSVLAAEDPQARFRALVFSKTTGFRHSSIDEGIAAIRALGAEHGFQVDATEDASAFRAGILSAYDTVVFLSTTGDVLDAGQQAAFEDYVRGGGGYTGVHAASDTGYGWSWYGRLVGAYFRDHPANQTATVRVEDGEHASTAGLPASFARLDEWYNFKSPDFATVGDADYSPRGDVHVLLTVDEATYDESDGTAEADDHPVTWCRRYDGGRSWYTAMGHTEASYGEPAFLKHLLGGLETTAGATPSDACGIPADRTAPTTTAVFDPAEPDGAAGWYRGPVTVTLAASDGDGSGVAATDYRLDGGEWRTYAGPFAVTGDGQHAVEFRSVDRKGNVEVPQTRTLRIDGTAPTASAALSPALPGPGGNYREPVTVALDGRDATSGVGSTAYRVDGGAWIAASAVTVASEGAHVVEYRATDAAGNVSAVGSVAFRIDTTAPRTTATLDPREPDKKDGRYRRPVTVTLDATDGGAGVAWTEYRLNGGAWTRYSGPFVVDRSGRWDADYRSADRAGNVEEPGRVSFWVSIPGSTG